MVKSPRPITDTTGGMPQVEAATYKGEQVAKIGPISRQTVGDIDIEIISTEAMIGGAVILARAWDQNGNAIGFGDGTVEIERFKSYNPPIHVDDGTFESVTAIIGGEQKTWQESNVKEDVLQATLNDLAHTISTIETFGPEAVIPGKIGNTTATFNPVAGANSPVDGYSSRDVSSETFSTIRNGAGVNADATTTYLPTGHVQASTTTDQYNTFNRVWMCFNTSSLGVGANISAATLSLYGNGNQTSSLGGTPALVACQGSLASTANVTTTDYTNRNFGATSFGSINFPLSVGTYNDIALNSNGLSAINVTGVTDFAVLNNWDFNNSFTGTWSSGGAAYAYCEAADNASSSKWPKLVVTYTAAQPNKMFLLL